MLLFDLREKRSRNRASDLGNRVTLAGRLRRDRFSLDDRIEAHVQPDATFGLQPISELVVGEIVWESFVIDVAGTSDCVNRDNGSAPGKRRGGLNRIERFRGVLMAPRDHVGVPCDVDTGVDDVFVIALVDDDAAGRRVVRLRRSDEYRNVVGLEQGVVVHQHDEVMIGGAMRQRPVDPAAGRAPHQRSFRLVRTTTSGKSRLISSGVPSVEFPSDMMTTIGL